jgi:hypothetical protein
MSNRKRLMISHVERSATKLARVQGDKQSVRIECVAATDVDYDSVRGKIGECCCREDMSCRRRRRKGKDEDI